MVRVLRWLGIIALIAAPAAAWLGRPMQHNCGVIYARPAPCETYYVSASWQIPATVTLISLGIGLLIVAWLVDRTQVEGG